MANIKSYTDIKQSKRLSEILPVESADMEYILEQWFDEKTQRYKEGFCEIPVVMVEDDCPLQQITIPCYSLSALLDILPLEVSINKQTDGVDTYYYIASYDARYCDIHSHRHINPIDACYEMIIKLNEQKLL